MDNFSQKNIAEVGLRFSGKSIPVSPLLDNTRLLRKSIFNDKTNFRIVLAVADLQPENVTIEFNYGSLKIQMVQDEPAENGRAAHLLKRICSYKYEIPETVEKETLMALWTSDDYLVIQTRKPASYFSQDMTFKIMPVRIGHVLKPFMDTDVLRETVVSLQKSTNELMTFVQANTTVPADKDVLGLGGGFESLKAFEIRRGMCNYMNRLKEEYENAKSKKISINVKQVKP